MSPAPGYSKYSANITCLLTGNWSGVGPACQATPCTCARPTIAPPVIIAHDPGQYLCNKTVWFTCSAGNFDTGAQEATCVNGDWPEVESNPPLCRPISCGAPVVSPNVIVVGDVFTFGNRVSFQCQIGWTLNGSSSAVCGQDGAWQYSDNVQPTCAPVDCGRPEVGDDVRIDGVVFTFDRIVHFTCDMVGFTAIPSEAECQADGTWSYGSTESICEVINCHYPNVSQHMIVHGNNYTFGAELMFDCVTGYNLVNGNSTTCLADGTWSKLPSCVAVSCGPPSVGPNVIIHGDNFSFPHTVWFFCKTGHFLTTSPSAECEANGTWSTSSQPTCKPVICGPPQVGEGVQISPGYVDTFGGTISMSCLSGRALNVDSNATCMATGQWSYYPNTPTCTFINCGRPPVGENVIINPNDYNYSENVFFLCQKGYFLVGTTTAHCYSNGSWSIRTQNTTCEPESCEKPDIGPHVIIRGSSFTLGSTVELSCPPGYLLQPDIVDDYCQLSEGILRWSIANMSNCTIVDCGRPDVGPRVMVIGEDFSANSSITLQCPGGYILKPAYSEQTVLPTATCLVSGHWSFWPGKPYCSAIQCSAISGNATVEAYSHSFNTTISLSCPAGYYLNVPSTATCEENGQWSLNATPTCFPISCGRPPEIPHMDLPLRIFLYGEEVIFHCFPGYNLQGARSAVCGSDGNWTWSSLPYGTPPYCQIVSCGRPQVDHFTIVHGKNLTFGSTIWFSCPLGFDLVNSQNMTCSDDGMWSNFLSTKCRAVLCSDILMAEQLPFGQIRQASLGVDDPSFPTSDYPRLFNATLSYECRPDYYLVGPNIRRCTPAGIWSGDVPYCKVPIQDCTSLTCPVNSSRLQASSCCSLTNISIGCCLPRTKDVLDARFNQISPTCSNALVDQLMPCAGRIGACLDTKRTYSLTVADCKAVNMYGCYRDQVPPTSLGNDLNAFCANYSSPQSIPCIERLRNSLTGEWMQQGLCLPVECAGDQLVLGQVAKATLTTYCTSDTQLTSSDYCQSSEITLLCSDGINTHHSLFDDPCSNGCDSEDDVTLSQCCIIGGQNVGCCKPPSKVLLNDHFNSLSGQCSTDLSNLLLQPCSQALVDCMNRNIDMTNSSHAVPGSTLNCPSFLGCSVSSQSMETCPSYAGANSQWCTLSVQQQHQQRLSPSLKSHLLLYVDSTVGLTTSTQFCLPASCNDEQHGQELVASQARLYCDLWRFSTRLDNCGVIQASLDCGSLHTEFTYNFDVSLQCPDPSPIENGAFSVFSPITDKRFAIGSQLIFTCSVGYRLTGARNTSMCNSNGQWSDEEPRCLIVDCKAPVVGPKVLVDGDAYIYNETVMFSCPHGYHVTVKNATCTADGSWDFPNMPMCNRNPSNSRLGIVIGCSVTGALLFIGISAVLVWRRPCRLASATGDKQRLL